MIQHHPDDNMLIEFANGSLDWGLSILISAHLEHCSQCRNIIKAHEQIGASLLSGCSAADFAPEIFNNVMEKILQLTHPHRENREESVAPLTEALSPPQYPRVLTKLFRRHPPQQWRRVFRHLQASHLTTGQHKYEINLHSISMGGHIDEHDHGGVEITLVISGSFSDVEGIYHVGDFISRTTGQIHKPVAGEHEDCLCLSAIDAPIKLTGIKGIFINPFLVLKPQ